jgi:hypothetical protein
MNAHFHGVGARLQYGDQFAITDTGTQTGNRSRDGGRVMGKIIVDPNLIDFTFELQPTFNPGKFGQRLTGMLKGHANMSCCRNRGQGIADIMLAQ